MNYMFRECNSLEKLNLSNFKCSKTCQMKGALEKCNSLVNLICTYDIRKRIKP